MFGISGVYIYVTGIQGNVLQDYIVIFCMYVFGRFHLTLGGVVLLALISNPRGFFSICGGEYSAGSYSRGRCKFVCYVLYML